MASLFEESTSEVIEMELLSEANDDSEEELDSEVGSNASVDVHELPTYMAIADGTSADANKLEWWKNHASEVPKWSSGCRAILLLQPSSAAAERVFSLLTNSFKEQQTHALEDYIETSVMLQYNKRH